MAGFIERAGSVRVTVRLPGGDRLTETFDTRPEAEAWASTQERKKAVGSLSASAGGGVTVAELLDAYDLAVASKQDSAKWNALRINKWRADPIAKLRVSRVTPHDINQWIDRRLLVVTSSTVNREMNLLSAAFTYAVKARKWLSLNPCHEATRPERGKPRDRRLLSPEEITALKIASGYNSDPRLWTLGARAGATFLLALETGMRSGEILRLKPEHYDRASRTVLVAATERGGRKGSRSGRAAVSSARSVPLTEYAIELIDQLLAHRPEGPYIVGMNDSQRDSNWRKAVKLSGVSGLTFHDSKHEACTRLSRFLDVLTLSHAIGTKDIRLLRDTYYNADASRAAKLLPSKLTE